MNKNRLLINYWFKWELTGYFCKISMENQTVFYEWNISFNFDDPMVVE